MPLPGWPTWNYQYSGLKRVGSRSGKNPPVWRPQRRPSKPEGFVFLGMEQVDKHWCPWNPTWTARATRWLWEKRPTSTRLCIFGFSFALNLHTKRLCLVSILRIGGASSHSTGYKPMNKTHINLVLAQLWECYEYVMSGLTLHTPCITGVALPPPVETASLLTLQGLLQCQSGEEHQGGRWIT